MTYESLALTENIYNRLGFLIRRAHQMSGSIFSEECAAMNITPAQYGILLVLRHGPAGMDQTRVAEALGQDRATTGQILRSLERRGLIERQVAPHDPRRKTLSVTPEGVALVDRTSQATPRIQQRLLSPLTAEEGQTLMHLLHKMVEASNAVARTRLALLAPAQPGRRHALPERRADAPRKTAARPSAKKAAAASTRKADVPKTA